MSETKTLVFPDGNGTNGLDPNLLLAMNGGGFGNNFGNGGWLWILFLFAMMNGGWGNGFGFGGNGNALNNDAGRQLLMQAIQGNGNAIAWGCDLTYDYVKINGDYRT